MLKLTQKTFIDKHKHKKVAYVDALLVCGEYSYPIQFDERTKKRIRAYYHSLGFKQGLFEENEPIADKVIEI